MKFGTLAVHAGVEADPTTGAIMTPIYQTSTYVQKSPGQHKGFEYSRSQNPTRLALEKSFASLEGAKYAQAYASGMAAIDTIIKLFKAGDEVICTNDLYGGSYRIFTRIFQDFGIKFHFVDMEKLKGVEESINKNTKLIWAETPTNPMMKVIDLYGLGKIAKANNILFAVDNTFSTPYLQKPISCGADLVMHSVTKYLAGHSDVVMGAIMTNSAELDEKLRFIQNACGGVPGPQDCFLVLRGIKTLHLRMQRHSENGRVIANYLCEHPKIKKVFWPGLMHHPNHEIAAKQMRDFGGMISFIMEKDTKEKAFEVLEKLKIFSLAESLGGVESLAGHPATMTHASIPMEERLKSGLTDSLIRLSVGIEDSDDLIKDLEQAIA
ncbi:MAG TPA: trans-sulfuration enzyme family protein [Cyclobacteriaceae bacterium]